MAQWKEYGEECTRCGNCIDVCLQYDRVEIIDRLIKYLEGDGQCPPISRCLTCGLCEEVCPQELSLKSLVKAAREKRVEEEGLKPLHFLTDPSSERNLLRTFEGGERRWHKKGGEIVYYPGCFASTIHPYMGEAAVRILEKLGIDFWVMSGVDQCCGAVAAGAGNTRPMKAQGRKITEELERRGAKTVIVSCPGCYIAFSKAYPQMFGEQDYELLHISQFLNGLRKREGIEYQEKIEKGVYYHDPCHLTRDLGIYEAPRELISSVPGTTLINDTPEGSECCGFGGGVRVSHPSRSIEIATQEKKDLSQMGVDAIITNCAGCMQNLIEGEGEIEVIDLTEYLLMAMGERVERDDRHMVDRLNRAYEKCLDEYETPALGISTETPSG